MCFEYKVTVMAVFTFINMLINMFSCCWVYTETVNISTEFLGCLSFSPRRFGPLKAARVLLCFPQEPELDLCCPKRRHRPPYCFQCCCWPSCGGGNRQFERTGVQTGLRVWILVPVWSRRSEQILRAQVDDDGRGNGLRLVVGTVDVQAACRQATTSGHRNICWTKWTSESEPVWRKT